MSRVTRFVGSAAELGPREIGVIASTDELARDGHVVEPSGIDLTAYRRNPVVLFNHDGARPIGVATRVGIEGGALAATIEFAPEGTSVDADLVCSMTKAGIVKGISIGFLPTESEPLDAQDRWAGQRITAAELLEISVVSVPADTGALVVARSFDARPGAVALLRSLPRSSAASIERVMGRFPPLARRSGSMLVGPNDSRPLADVQRDYCRQTWAIGAAKTAEAATRRRQRAQSLALEQATIEGVGASRH